MIARRSSARDRFDPLLYWCGCRTRTRHLMITKPLQSTNQSINDLAFFGVSKTLQITPCQPSSSGNLPSIWKRCTDRLRRPHAIVRPAHRPHFNPQQSAARPPGLSPRCTTTLHVTRDHFCRADDDYDIRKTARSNGARLQTKLDTGRYANYPLKRTSRTSKPLPGSVRAILHIGPQSEVCRRDCQ
jgi:hypothetical protein